MILNLKILPKYLIGMFEGIYNSENCPILKLGSEWKEIINPSTVDLYFHVILILIYYYVCKNIYVF